MASRPWAGLDEPVRRYFEHALPDGPPPAPGTRLTMRGRIKVGRWLPFTATWEGDGRSFAWRARAAGGLLRVVDGMADGHGAMDVRLLGRIRLVHAADDDTTRSAAGRAAIQAAHRCPAALLPERGVTWRAEAGDLIVASWDVPPERPEVRLRIDERGAIVSGVVERWDNGDHGLHGYIPCGGDTLEERRFGALVLPSRGTGGWGDGTPRYAPLFEAGILAAQPPGEGPPGRGRGGPPGRGGQGAAGAGRRAAGVGARRAAGARARRDAAAWARRCSGEERSGRGRTTSNGRRPGTTRPALLRAPRARLPRLPRVRARPVAQHPGGLPQRPPPVRRLPPGARRRRHRGGALAPRGLPGRAGGRHRGAPARAAGDAPAQGGLPALLLPPPAPRERHHARPDRGAPCAAQEPAAAEGADPRRGEHAAGLAARERPRCAARPRAARAHVRLRSAGHRGDRPRGGRPRPQARRPARPRQGLQGAPRPRRARGDRRGADLPRAGPSRARRRRRRPPSVRQPPRHRPDAPGPLQDRPAPRPGGGAGGEDEPAHAASHVRHAPARGRL